MASLRIGLIGTGRIVPAHLYGYAQLRKAGVDDFRITAICSRDPARARLLLSADGADRSGAAPWRYGDPLTTQSITVADFQDDVSPAIFTDLQAMLDSGTVDAVDISTEVALHHDQVVACLKAGLHVLVEKPMAITIRAARMMVEAAQPRPAVGRHRARPLSAAGASRRRGWWGAAISERSRCSPGRPSGRASGRPTGGSGTGRGGTGG